MARHHRAAEADLYAARGDELHDLGTVLHLDIEGDVRIAGAEVLQKVRQIILAGHRGGRDGDRTFISCEKLRSAMAAFSRTCRISLAYL